MPRAKSIKKKGVSGKLNNQTSKYYTFNGKVSKTKLRKSYLKDTKRNPKRKRNKFSFKYGGNPIKFFFLLTNHYFPVSPNDKTRIGGVYNRPEDFGGLTLYGSMTKEEIPDSDFSFKNEGKVIDSNDNHEGIKQFILSLYPFFSYSDNQDDNKISFNWEEFYRKFILKKDSNPKFNEIITVFKKFNIPLSFIDLVNLYYSLNYFEKKVSCSQTDEMIEEGKRILEMEESRRMFENLSLPDCFPFIDPSYQNDEKLKKSIIELLQELKKEKPFEEELKKEKQEKKYFKHECLYYTKTGEQNYTPLRKCFQSYIK